MLILYQHVVNLRCTVSTRHGQLQVILQMTLKEHPNAVCRQSYVQAKKSAHVSGHASTVKAFTYVHGFGAPYKSFGRAFLMLIRGTAHNWVQSNIRSCRACRT